MTTRDSLHALIDSLPECDLHMAELLIEWRHKLADDPFLVAIATAPLDDEPETPEERAAVEEGRRDYEAGRFITAEQARRELLG